MLYRALAYGTALSHLAFVVALVGGAWWVARRPERWKLHLPVVLAMATVSLAGADCPLTVLENHFRELGGWERYGSGFISHYLVEPLHSAGITPAVRALIIALWVVPNALAYAVVVRDRRRLTAARGW